MHRFYSSALVVATLSAMMALSGCGTSNGLLAPKTAQVEAQSQLSQEMQARLTIGREVIGHVNRYFDADTAFETTEISKLTLTRKEANRYAFEAIAYFHGDLARGNVKVTGTYKYNEPTVLITAIKEIDVERR